VRTETCDACGFDSSRWNAQDTRTTIASLAVRWRLYLEGLPPALALVRPDDTTWSIAEYTDHVREVLWSMRFIVELARSEPGRDLGDVPTATFAPSVPEIDLARALADLDHETAALFDLARVIPVADWDSAVVVDGDEWSIGWTFRHAVHDVSHHLGDVGRIRRRLGDGTPHQVGWVTQINTSSGGVPKHPVADASVSWSGLDGDHQTARQHHGRPWQALSLWSAEVIAALQAEGHPIQAGNAGENLTVSGLDWSQLRPGTRLRVGEVVAEVSSYAIPCRKNAPWFADGAFDRMHHERHPGWSRLYASVLRPGRIAVGDDVEVEPA
jgi:MOSC domain-containing protein YiiM